MEFYAHSTSRTDRSDWQLLRVHHRNVGDLAGDFGAAFGARELARVQGLLHDLGKYCERFQRDRLSGQGPSLDHSTRGAQIVVERYKTGGVMLAYGIAGHHAGLANGQLGEGRRALFDRLSKDSLAELPPLLPDWEAEVDLPEKLGLPEGFRVDKSRAMFQLTLLTRMLFSCLVDADFIDTDNFYRSIEGKPPRPSHGRPSLIALRDQLNAHLAKMPTEGSVNHQRKHILDHVRSGASHSPGLFSLTVPTGGGKTLASMAFALDHAIAHGLDRVIYVIPYTSIVEQNASVFEAAFGDLGKEAVVQHHSAFFDDPRAVPESIDKRKLATENWDAPVIVTTAVQFFESLFADRPSKCRKLHNIASSVVILDEAQTMPLELLKPCVTLLKELAHNYRVSPVICTATQPALDEDKGFEDGFIGVRELAPSPEALYEAFRRVTVRHIGDLDDSELEGHLRRREQVLCIVNNRLHARKLFESIADEPGACHLTTLMYAKHRSEVLADIRERLKQGKPCRLIATSLIEAGVDVDFPTVLRAEAGLDSIAQAAGRCNREGRQQPEDSEVMVFRPLNPDWSAPKEVDKAVEAFHMIRRFHEKDLLGMPAITAYFQELYWKKGRHLDAKDILGMIGKCDPRSMPMETITASFQMMPDSMRQIIIPFDASGKEIPEVVSALSDLAYAPGAARKLQPYIVQLPKKAYDALWQGRAINNVDTSFGGQFIVLSNSRLYHKDYGLHWVNPQFIEAEKLVG